MTPQELKNSILQLAIQGKLVEQRPEEGTGGELFKQIQDEKYRLIKAATIKKETPLPEITEDEKPFDIPDSWKWVYIGDLFQHNTGKALNSSNRDGTLMKYITTSNLYWNRFELDKLSQMLFTKPEVEKCTVVKGDLLVLEGGDVGRAAIWNYDFPMRIQNHIHRLRPYANVCIEFFYHVFFLYKFAGLINGKGIGIQGLSSSAIHKLMIPLPPLSEQKRIVAKIEELLPYIDRYEQAWGKLEDFNKRFPKDMQKSILQMAIQGKLVEHRSEEGTAEELLPLCRDDKARSIKEGKYKNEAFRGAISNSDCIPFEVPNSWTWMYISDMSLFQEGPGILAMDFRSAGVPLIRIAGMQTDIVSLEGCNYLDEDMVALKWAHFRLDLGDIVISTSASTDKIAEVNEECVGSIPYTGLIRFKMYGEIDKNYFKWFIKSPCYIKQVEEQKAGGTIKHYGPSHLSKMVIPLPPPCRAEAYCCQTARNPAFVREVEGLKLVRMKNMTKEEKPMLDTDGQIKHLQAKGVKFNRITIEEATAYLRENNNYFKLRAYRKNFPQHPNGNLVGQYIDLDFASLMDLAIIDMRMRYIFMQMALDIEHFAKVHLLRVIEESDNDGYQIVKDYFDSLKESDSKNATKQYDRLLHELNRNRNNPYCGGIIAKYNGCYPVWAFIEIASFGTLIHFYGFCAYQLNNKNLKDRYYLLLTIKELRNAAAHSNCLIHDMGVKDSEHASNYSMLRALSAISKATRDNQLKNERMRQIITLLYVHTILVTSSGVHEHTKNKLSDLVSRMYRHSDYYKGNENILASFGFFNNVLDILFA